MCCKIQYLWNNKNKCNIKVCKNATLKMCKNAKLKAICEYKRKGQTSDFKLLSDAEWILCQTVHVKEVERLSKAFYIPCDHRKLKVMFGIVIEV